MKWWRIQLIQAEIDLSDQSRIANKAACFPYSDPNVTGHPTDGSAETMA